VSSHIENPYLIERRQVQMVLYVVKWDILPDKEEAYLQWSEGAIQRIVAVPGVLEVRAYRPSNGASQVVGTCKFADLAAWSAFYAHEDTQKVWDELKTLTTNLTAELWSPSPVVPEPIQPEDILMII
jgi:antibiotic biosynthesis monooxygenase (ABM) superfamily enzyme